MRFRLALQVLEACNSYSGKGIEMQRKPNLLHLAIAESQAMDALLLIPNRLDFRGSQSNCGAFHPHIGNSYNERPNPCFRILSSGIHIQVGSHPVMSDRMSLAGSIVEYMGESVDVHIHSYTYFVH